MASLIDFTPRFFVFIALLWQVASAQPIALHPQNPHYFVYKGKPTVLITSGEHYGAVMNLDFDYVTYLKTLQRDGLNLTRTMSGQYVEPVGAFGITNNTLAPASNRYVCPWARSAEPGYANGGTKFDLTKWDDAYFQRLKAFVGEAQRRGVFVEFTLFCPFYDDSKWNVSPLNPKNNISKFDTLSRLNVYTLDKNKGLLAVHETMVRKVVTELNSFDNVLFEICNEPYFGGVTMAWQHRIADVITETERSLPRKHLITQNIQNGWSVIEKPHPAVSVFNFHYATPPKAVALNYGLNKALGDNETGFRGTADTTYRKEGWEYILAGGALYNNLDYSFNTAYPNGTSALAAKEPGGGSPTLRRQLSYLVRFMRSFDYIRTRPDTTLLAAPLPGPARVQALSEPGKQYALYVYKAKHPSPNVPLALKLTLPAGRYNYVWTNPASGEQAFRRLDHKGGPATLNTPPFEVDMALLIRRE